MKENLLYHIWQFKKFNTQNLYTTIGNKVEIIDVGYQNKNASQEFIFARIKIDDIEWNGNVEVHVKSSDCSKHKYNFNSNYNNLILYVVYEIDDNEDKTHNSFYPILELKSHISCEIWDNYNLLEYDTFRFIPCENLINNSIFSNIFSFTENLYLDKLKNKCIHIYNILKCKKNDWEAVVTTILGHTLGLKINAEVFEQLFLSLDHRIIRKISKNQFQAESLLFGTTHDLKSCIDSYPQNLYKEFKFIQTKFNIPDKIIDVKYFKLRPSNYPSIRLSQLANIISKYQNLFSYIIGIKSVNQYYLLLEDIKASDYWTDHYIFDKKTVHGNEKRLSKSQKDLIILNAFLPVKFAYSKSIGKSLEEEIFEILYEIKSENNSIIKKYNNLGVKFNSALDSQAYLYLYKNKCLKKQCLNCVIGYRILK